MDEIGLEEAIRAVRRELTAAMGAGVDEPIRFRVNTVRLDFQVLVSREAEGSAKVKFWVIEAGASGKLASSATHTVHVELDPVTALGESVEVGGREESKPE